MLTENPILKLLKSGFVVLQFGVCPLREFLNTVAMRIVA